jgi:hypothetical protein
MNLKNYLIRTLTRVFLGALLFQILFVSCGTKETNISNEVKENIRERVKNGESVGIVVGFIDDQGNREYFSHGTMTKNGEETGIK